MDSHKIGTLISSLVPFTVYYRPRIQRISQSAVIPLVPKSADFEVLVYPKNPITLSVIFYRNYLRKLFTYNKIHRMLQDLIRSTPKNTGKRFDLHSTVNYFFILNLRSIQHETTTVSNFPRDFFHQGTAPSLAVN